MSNYDRAKMQAYMAHRRLTRQQELRRLLGGRCATCGSEAELEFDHIDRSTKDFGISGRGLDRTWVALLKELEKCQLLCKPCHVNKTREERQAAFVPKIRDHGIQKYHLERCRCEICRTAKAAARRKYTHGSAPTLESRGRL